MTRSLPLPVLTRLCKFEAKHATSAVILVGESGKTWCPDFRLYSTRSQRPLRSLRVGSRTLCAMQRTRNTLAPEEPNVYRLFVHSRFALQRSAMFPVMNRDIDRVPLLWSGKSLWSLGSINITSLRDDGAMLSHASRAEYPRGNLFNGLHVSNRNGLLRRPG